ncbi:MAG: hypothetical protein IGS48_09975 [Oscillatoriales cyanobacterium C42_A2020_001]|nr:hypothetical protein [Leptolyngbyaceae cyanobacterium C42_A2020_001]
MALQPRKRSRSTIVNADSVEQASLFLQELPEKQKENLSLREAVGQMQDSIKAALSKGYTYDELAKMLANQGIQISAFTLKNYVPSGKRSAPKAKTTQRTKKLKGDEASQQLDLSELETASSQESDAAVEASAGTAETSDAPPAEKPRRGRKAATSDSAAKATAKKPTAAKSTTKTTTTRGRKRATA